MALDIVEDSQLTKLSKDGRLVLNLARRLEWTAVWENAQHKVIRLVPPENARSRSPYRVPTTNLNQKRVRALIRQIIHASNEEVVMRTYQTDTALDLMERGVTPEVVAEVRKSLGPAIPRPQEPEQQQAEPEPVVEVSRRPFHAKGGNGVTYESEYSLEVHYSDGTVRWECAHPECDYTSEKSGRSVSHHYVQAHGSLRQATEVVHKQGDDHPVYERNGSEVSHGETPPETKPEGDRLAQWLQQFIEAEVEREMAKQQQFHEEEKAALQAQIDSLTTELDQCREEAERYRSNMITVRDLMTEVIG